MVCCRTRGDPENWVCYNRESREGPWAVFLVFYMCGLWLIRECLSKLETETQRGVWEDRGRVVGVGLQQ